MIPRPRKPLAFVTSIAFAYITAILALLSVNVTYGVELPPDFTIQPYVSGLNGPIKMAWTADGQTLYIAEKSGSVRVVHNGVLAPTQFIDLSDEVNRSGDRGLLGLALSPNFPTNNWVYLLYTYDPPQTAQQTGNAGRDGLGQRVSRLIRVQADSATNFQTAVPGSEQVVLGGASIWANIGDPEAPQTDLSAAWACGPSDAYLQDCLPSDGLSHSIGTVAFGSDGQLYVGNGDAANYTTVDPRALRSLSVDSLAGKILRIDPATGAGLSNNPFWNGDPQSNRSKVWQLGLRNPFRFQPADDGKVWIGDVGWTDWEELNEGPSGADFGWPCFEGDDSGSAQQPGYAALSQCQSYYTEASPVSPRYAYPHTSAGGSIITGAFYTATKWPAQYQGKLFISDYSMARMDVVDIDSATPVVVPFASDLIAVDITVGPDGDLYYADIWTGAINKIVFNGDPQSEPKVTITAPASGTVAAVGESIAFAGIAVDAEDDDITLSAGLIWTSDLDGQIGIGPGFSTAVLSPGQHQITASVTDSTGATGSDTVSIRIVTGSRPTAAILTPSPTSRWQPNDVVVFSGTASDSEDGTLDGESLSWEAVIHHNEHEHGDFLNATGASGSFPYPDHDDNSYLQLCLTATDSSGLTDLACVNLLPMKVAYTFDSVPRGLNITYNSTTAATPFTVDVNSGSSRQIDAPTPQGASEFASWSIGGPATQQITIGSTDQTIIAYFNSPPLVTITQPSDGAAFAAGASINFGGTASDAEDDDAVLSAALLWSSDVDGVIGSGGAFSIDTLSVGQHVITASVADSGGASGSDTIAITVGSGDWQPQAGYRTDFQIGAPAPNWSYLWNANGPIGIANGYASLLWSGSAYDSDGVAGLPDAGESGYGALQPGGGHPGRGINQGAGADRYVIAAYTVPIDGSYRISGSSITHTSCQWTNGLLLAVFTNDVPVLQSSVAQGESATFDTALGNLVAGDTIYVAAGPNAADGCDRFEWDFTVDRRTSQTTNSPPLVTITQPSDGAAFAAGASINFGGTASDAEDDDAVLSAALLWSSDIDGIIGSGGAFSIDTLSVGQHVITASVADSGGASGSDTIIVDVVNGNTAPVVTITQPADRATFALAETVEFSAAVSDVEDDDASLAASLIWTSSIDGEFGTGANFSTSALSKGRHRITASVVDNDGATASGSVVIRFRRAR